MIFESMKGESILSKYVKTKNIWRYQNKLQFFFKPVWFFEQKVTIASEFFMEIKKIWLNPF